MKIDFKLWKRTGTETNLLFVSIKNTPTETDRDKKVNGENEKYIIQNKGRREKVNK